MARTPNPEIRQEDLHGFKCFKLLLPMLERLHNDACARDPAGNRRLHFDQYAALILLYYFNPIVTSLALRRRESEASPWLVARKNWPVEPPCNWRAFVNRPATEAELDPLRQCIARGSPYGKQSWQVRTAARLKLECSLRPTWRPKRASHDKIK